jgi:ATP-dependent RNA helicase DOB1
VENERDGLVVEQEGTIAEYHDLKEKIGVYEQDMKDVMNHPNYCLPFIQPGRLVRIKHENRLFDWGVVINFSKRLKPFVLSLFNYVLTSQSQEEDFKPQESYIVDVAMWIDASSVSSGQRIKQKDLPAILPGPAGINSKTGRMEVVPVIMSTVDGISQIRVPLPSDLKGAEQRLDLRKTVEEVKRRFPDGLPNLDPIKNMSITDESFRTLVKVLPTTYPY